MNILWITTQLPCRRSGGQVRQYYLLKHLCKRHNLTVLSLVQPAERGEIEALQRLNARVITEKFVPPQAKGKWSNRFLSWSQLLFDRQPHHVRTYPLDGLHQLLCGVLAEKNPDIVHFDDLSVVSLSENIGSLPWVLTEHNVESYKHDRLRIHASTPTRRLAGWIESKKLYYWERKWVRRSSACIAMSDIDANLLQELAPSNSIVVIPNGVETDYFTPPMYHNSSRTDLIFFGRLSYAPNSDALNYFCQDIFPIIRSRIPEINLRIIGSDAPAEIVALEKLPGVTYTGFVPDIRPHLWSAAVCVVPLRSGGGTRLKILEAMAAGLPIVSTKIGAEGLQLRDGQDLLIEEDPIKFASSVLRLLQDPDQQERLRKSGQRTVSNLYDWGTIAPKQELVYETIIDRFTREQ